LGESFGVDLIGCHFVLLCKVDYLSLIEFNDAGHKGWCWGNTGAKVFQFLSLSIIVETVSETRLATECDLISPKR
jgi:hypothetical protein